MFSNPGLPILSFGVRLAICRNNCDYTDAGTLASTIYVRVFPLIYIVAPLSGLFTKLGLGTKANLHK